MPHIAKNVFGIIFINNVIIYSIFCSFSPSQYWQPEQTLLPTNKPPNLLNYTGANGDYATHVNDVQKLTSILQLFQESIDSKLGSISHRLDALETWQKTLEEDIKSTTTSSSTSVSPKSLNPGSTGKRRRNIPLVLQVRTFSPNLNYSVSS